MPDLNFQLKSVISRYTLAKPLFVIVIINVIVACVFGSVEGEVWHLIKNFLIFFICSLGVYGLIVLFILWDHTSLEIKDGKVILKKLFSSKKTIYELTDISDFKWNNKPELRGNVFAGSPGFPGQTINNDLAKNEIIQIYFKNDEGIEIDFTAYKNFDEIKQFFYDYCIKNNIIYVPSLGDRKYGTAHRNNRKS